LYQPRLSLLQIAVSGLAFCAVLLASLGWHGAAAQDAKVQDAKETLWPIGEWQTASPEEEGMDSAALAGLVAFGKTRSFDSLLIARHGRIVLDAYYAPYSADIPHVVNSTTKAVIGTLIAMAHRDGLLDSFDHPALDLLGDREIANVDDRKKAITVQNLLNMTSGLDWDEGIDGGKEQSLVELGRSPDWVKYILDRPMAHAPGEVFYYNSGGTHLLSALITKLTGKRAADYANDRLFGPLGIAPPFWRRDPQGVSTGGFGLALKPRDMAKIGYLYLRKGKWGDKELLQPEWIEAVSHATVDMNAKFDPGLRYSNLFWALPDRHVFMSVGYHCQVIMVLPDPDIVAVMTARNFCPFRKLADDISAAVKSDSALPSAPEAAASLARAISDIATEKSTEVGTMPEIASAISGKTYRFSPSALDLKSLTLFLTEANPHVEWEAYRPDPASGVAQRQTPIGLDGVYRKGAPTPFGFPALKGAWLDGQTFVVDLQYVGRGEERKWILTFNGDKLTIKSKTRDGREISIEGANGG
jgi:CubicO group peptidase (beta-lactamase class C family)